MLSPSCFVRNSALLMLAAAALAVLCRHACKVQLAGTCCWQPSVHGGAATTSHGCHHIAVSVLSAALLREPEIGVRMSKRTPGPAPRRPPLQG